MKLRIREQKSIIGVLIVALCLIGALTASAQEEETPKKRLVSGQSVQGVIGGEAHASCVIRARKGQVMNVRMSGKMADQALAEFTISRSGNVFSASPAEFGKESDDGRKWTGTIRASGTYYIYVVARPIAHYTMRVRLK